MSFDLTNFQVGDEFEKSPYETGRIISAILAEEGSFDYVGSSIIITSLPNRKSVAYAPNPIPEAVRIIESYPIADLAYEETEPIVEKKLEETATLIREYNKALAALEPEIASEPVLEANEEIVDVIPVTEKPKTIGRPRKK